jgi:hypothetical protein
MPEINLPLAWDTEAPCESCPYRKDAQLELWHPSEFENLLEHNKNEIQGNLFACHGTKNKEQRSVCAGWLIDQRKRGLPSIQLRLSLMRNEEAQELLKKVNDGGHELYDSIEEMCAMNRVKT